MVNQKKDAALARLERAAERLVNICKSMKRQAGTNTLVAMNVRLALCAAYAYCPEEMSRDMQRSGIDPEGLRLFMGAFGFSKMSRDEAIETLWQVAKGDLTDDHPQAVTAMKTLGHMAESTFKEIERQYREEAASSDFMGRARRVDGCAFSGKKQR